MKALLNRPFMGTDLTIGGAIATVAVAPAAWSIFALAFVAMPS
ncbi:hypothetical protein U1872_07970 [Sphingomonas sp. RB3P16]